MGLLRAVFVCVAAAAALIPILGRPVSPGSSAVAATTPADIVIILTDDQRWDTLWAMPNVQADLVGSGIGFTNAFVVNPLCCPSRTSILTGEYSHTTDIYKNEPPHGGFQDFVDTSTVATWLHDAGYRTGLVGKYLNGYSSAQAAYIPPGWDRWFALLEGSGYYDWDASVDGVLTHYGHAIADYSTDVLASEADSFIRDAPPGQPLFLLFTPFAPHVPATPPDRYQTRFSGLPPYRPPSYNEADVSDKPEYIQATPPLSRTQRQQIDQLRRNQYRTLLAVDDAVGEVLTALSDTGRLSHTLVVFLSDNGQLWGEHRWYRKEVPYEESIRVPLVVRYDPLIAAARNDGHAALNVDLAPTMAELAGLTIPPTVEGSSLVPLFTSPPPPWRSDFLFEHLQGSEPDDTVPTFCAVRNRSFSYVAYYTGEEELYDVKLDPYQLINVATDPRYQGQLQAMRDRKAELCVPPPPGVPFVSPGDPSAVPRAASSFLFAQRLLGPGDPRA